MSSKPKQPDDKEGWEGLAEEESRGVLAPDPELEAALQEAADAVDDEGELRRVDPEDPESEDDELDRLRKELLEARDQYVRLQADYQNFRRRAQREREELLQYGHENLVKDLLSTVDNLDRAIDAARRNDGGDLESFLQGIELLRRELLGILQTHAVTRIEAVGEPFDPAVHEAMAQAPDASVAPNTVVDELQKGYQLRGRLLRPARVVVAKSPEEPSEAGGEAAD